MPRGLRLRVFAGPNGSGKSTIINDVRRASVNGRPIDFGIYINADDLAQRLPEGVDLHEFEIEAEEQTFRTFAEGSGLLIPPFDEDAFLRSYTWENNVIRARRSAPRDRLAQLLAQFLYQELLGQRIKFSFETVFSHRGKLDLMRKATDAGYKVYLYFISTEDPAINVERVKTIRVGQGGHDVPKDKIISRYYRTMDLLDEALSISYHAFLWDNSQTDRPSVLFAEMKKSDAGPDWKIISDNVPLWFMSYFLLRHKNDPTMMEVYRAALDAFKLRSRSPE